MENNFDSRARIILTGAAGFLGKEIFRHLTFCGNEVLTIGRNSQNSLIYDLSREIPFISSFDIDIVVHAAGKAHVVSKSKNDENDFFAVNVIGTQNLLTALELTKRPKKFIFISSVAVYGKEYGTNITESESLNANNSYGLSKIKAEILVLDWCKRNNVVCTILRLPLVVGKAPPGNLGAMVKAIRGGYYFNINAGKARKSMVLSSDVAKFINIIAPIGGIYNLTDGHHPSIGELSLAIAKKKILNLPLLFAKVIGIIGDMLGSKAPINSDTVKKITRDLVFNDTKAQKIGWRPQSVIEYLNNNDL